MKDKVIKQVNLHNTSEGAMGILSKHVPSLIELRPGLIEVIVEGSEGSKKLFASAGFATVNPDNTIDISAMDAYDLEDFDATLVSNLIIEHENNLKNSSKNAVEKCNTEISLETLKSLQNALQKK